ncbi:MAG: hypothetical protein CVT79_00780 [Alphaproteobacteria bacterium HGW-Alphaproteobacteria-18]|nr:MAG: hypothetical protein CVT79_00780 [Alphaproteobacteria bacterium HGW-Alphaproteobacteria-18]
MSDWNFDLIPVGLVLLVLMGGVWTHNSRAGSWQRDVFVSIAASGLVVAFISPLCALTVALFSARSLHHLVLICMIAPALALSFRRLRFPDKAGGLSFAALSLMLWAWHVPVIYSAAWDSHAVYWAMQFALIGTAWAFWSVVLRQEAGSARLGIALMLAGLAGQMGLIGAILTFSGNVLYTEHILLTDVFGISALGDQQLAGLLMWVPGMIPLGIFAALILRRGWREVSAA